MTDLIEKMILAYYPGEEDLSAEFINGNVEDMKAVARVMLEAMREPSDAMCKAWDAACNSRRWKYLPAADAWEVMLDAYAKENGL